MLLVDVGNTRIKWGCAQDKVMSDYGVLTHRDKPISKVLTSAWDKLRSPARVVVANVAGAHIAEELAGFCRQHFQCEPEYMQATSQAGGITNGYVQPSQLGADRWAAVIGARHRYKGPLCIIDCGTAITVDTVNREGQHLGGLIAPGIGAMQEALVAAAPALPKAMGESATLFAGDTRSAVTSGILHTVAGLVERVAAKINAAQGAQTKLLLTGGDAERVQSMVQVQFILVPHLVLEGLAVLAGQQT